MPQVEHGFIANPIEVLRFSLVDMAASQTDQAIDVLMNAAASGTLGLTNYQALKDGWIFAISVTCNTNVTAQANAFTPTINGTKITTPAALIVTVANATKVIRGRLSNPENGAPFAAGDLIGVKYTTDANHLPVTVDLMVEIYIAYNNLIGN